ncbi:MAG: M14 family zinc carboxypeptidase [Phycisphaerae bacterium]
MVFRRHSRVPAAAPIVAAILAPFLSPRTSMAQVAPREPAWLPPTYRYAAPPLTPGALDPALPTPDAVLGFPVGTRPATHAQIERCLNTWKDSPRLRVHTYGQTHERRTLYFAVVTSPKNHARLAEIRAAIGKLADPRKLRDDAEAAAIARDTPAIAWMAYSIHGDELSSSDAALVVLHHLIACEDEEIARLLDELVIVFDPLMNPDGRDRIIRQLDEVNGYTPNLDAAAVQHAGRWPYGRGNHYLFDMNRDWIFGTQPETRGRQRLIAEWHPQLLVDSHEMGPHETYLFNPPREPINPNVRPQVRAWWMKFAADQAAALDRFGWSYYTREWADFWYPGYSDAYGVLHGAIGILYEQAETGGRPIRQETGQILTYREAVHRQSVSSLTNLRTLRANREGVLTDFLHQHRAWLTPPADAPPLFVMPRGANASRERRLLELLHNQGAELEIANESFRAAGGMDAFGERFEEREFSAGTIIVRRAQPRGGLVATLLDFDPRMIPEFLNEERRELETKRQSRIYDITAWSLPMAYALESYWCTAATGFQTRTYVPEPEPAGAVLDAAATPYAASSAPATPPVGTPATTQPRVYAHLIDGADDTVERALAQLLMHGVRVRVAEKDFHAAGRSFERGSLLIRRHENDANLDDALRAVAAESGAAIHAATTGRSPDDGPDLGGGHFLLLRTPRVALFGGSAVSTYSYGQMWHLLDHELGLPASLFDVAARGALDLRRYDVVILPSPNGGGAAAYGPLIDDVKVWVNAGGTLIALDGAADYLADEKLGLSAVRRRPDVLKDIDEYLYAAALDRSAGRMPVQPAEVWETPTERFPATMPAEASESERVARAQDEWRRVFSPVGAIARAASNREHWLTFGCGATLPVFVEGSSVLLAKSPVAAPVRFAQRAQLRLSGLLWPEAAARLEGAAVATVERVGNGQVILFAYEPNLRAAWRATRRLVVNAILLGPGCGTSPPIPQ